jgi:peptide deformylase
MKLAAANAPWKSAAGMAAPQWGFSKKIFVWSRGVRGADAIFEAVFNPSYEAEFEGEGEDFEEDIEGCFSVPGKRGVVRRHRRVRAVYWTADGVRHEEALEGYVARVFQHETDHLLGFLYDNTERKLCLRQWDADA